MNRILSKCHCHFRCPSSEAKSPLLISLFQETTDHTRCPQSPMDQGKINDKVAEKDILKDFFSVLKSCDAPSANWDMVSLGRFSRGSDQYRLLQCQLPSCFSSASWVLIRNTQNLNSWGK